MNKKGFAMIWILIFYFLLNIVIFASLYGVVSANKDDTAYTLDFYSRDMAYGVEKMLWNDAEISYVYPIKKGYSVVGFDYDQGILTVGKGYSKDSYEFSPRNDYGVKIGYVDYNGGNAVLFEKTGGQII